MDFMAQTAEAHENMAGQIGLDKTLKEMNSIKEEH
jgi:hypothetical protein